MNGTRHPMAWPATMLLLTLVAQGCAFPRVDVQTVRFISLHPGESRTVIVTAPVIDAFCNPDDIGQFCADFSGLVYEYRVEDLPAGVTSTIDTSLQSASTPDVVRITFDAALTAEPVDSDVAIHALLGTRTLGTAALKVTVVSDVPELLPAPIAIAAHANSSRGVDASGRVWVPDVDRPTVLGEPDGFVAVAAGSDHTLALHADGTAWSWGDDFYGQLGNDEDFTPPTYLNDPVQVAALSGIAAIAAGGLHSLALTGDGIIWAWGAAERGQLGIEDNRVLARRGTPIRVPILSNMRAIAAGEEYSLALAADGTVWAWGSNSDGQLGVTTELLSRSTPAMVPGLTSVRAIAAGAAHALALRSDGSVWAWGRNQHGQLGDGTSGAQSSRSTPLPVSGLSGAQSVAAGGAHSMAIMANGTVMTWGANSNGQLGDGTDSERPNPVLVSALSGVQAIAAGGSHSLALLRCGQVWTWGANQLDQLGDSVEVPSRAVPLPVNGFRDESSCARLRIRVHLTGDGRGTIASDMGELTCDDDECVETVERNAVVTLAAMVEDEDSVFEGWRLDCQGTSAEVILALDSSKRCEARFEARQQPDAGPYLLTVSPGGGGLITSSGGGMLGPEHIDCGSTCSAIFSLGGSVTLTAIGDSGFGFVDWGSDCTGSAAQTVIVMDAPRTCHANFRPFSLGARVVGAGRVTSDPAGLDCNDECTFAPRAGTATLTATASRGWQFDQWSGDCSGLLAQTTVAMTGDKNCTATFTRIPGLFFLRLVVEGEGLVTSAPSGISCPAICTTLFAGGVAVALTAHHTAQWRVLQWSDDCPAGEIQTNQVVMTADTQCRVVFTTQSPYPVSDFTFTHDAHVGQVIAFDGSLSHVTDPATGTSDPSGITFFEWDFDGDGVFEARGGPASAVMARHAFQTPGVHDVRLRVSGGPFNHTDDRVLQVTVGAATTALAGLTIQKAGDGHGAIISNPQGMFLCDGTCPGIGPLLLESGTSVTLVALSNPGSRFDGWSGSGCTGASESIAVTMNAARTCTARFTLVATPLAACFTFAVIDPSRIQADASCSTGSIVTYRWWPRFLGGSQAPSFTESDPIPPRFLYELQGVNTIRLEVIDSNGNSAVTTLTFTSG